MAPWPPALRSTHPPAFRWTRRGNIDIADSLNSSIRKLTPLAALPTPAISLIGNAGSDAGGPVAPGERVILTGTTLRSRQPGDVRCLPCPGTDVVNDEHPGGGSV